MIATALKLIDDMHNAKDSFQSSGFRAGGFRDTCYSCSDLVLAYTFMARMQAELGDEVGASDTLNTLIKALESVQNVNDVNNIYELSEIAVALAFANNLTGARSILNEIAPIGENEERDEYADLRATILMEFAVAQAIGSANEAALSTLNEAREAAARILPMRHRPEALIRVAITRARMGEVSESLRELSTIPGVSTAGGGPQLDRNGVPIHYVEFLLLPAATEGVYRRLKAKNFTGAVEILERIEGPPEYRILSLLAIGRLLSKHGYVDDAAVANSRAIAGFGEAASYNEIDTDFVQEYFIHVSRMGG